MFPDYGEYEATKAARMGTITRIDNVGMHQLPIDTFDGVEKYVKQQKIDYVTLLSVIIGTIGGLWLSLWLNS